MKYLPDLLWVLSARNTCCQRLLPTTLHHRQLSEKLPHLRKLKRPSNLRRLHLTTFPAFAAIVVAPMFAPRPECKRQLQSLLTSRQWKEDMAEDFRAIQLLSTAGLSHQPPNPPTRLLRI